MTSEKDESKKDESEKDESKLDESEKDENKKDEFNNEDNENENGTENEKVDLDQEIYSILDPEDSTTILKPVSEFLKIGNSEK